MATVCLVEDDLIMGESLQQRFELEELRCDWFHSAEAALPGLLAGKYAALISDIRLPGMSGQQLFETLLKQGQGVLPTLFMTGFGTVDQAVHLLKLGAADYITKPFDIEQLLAKLHQITPELFAARQDQPAVLGISESMRKIEAQLRRATKFNVPVLITGASGVGKEHAARYFHQQLATTAAIPFVSINCAAVQESLLEAELFGHEKGAFTGADRRRPGLFEHANGGVLLLDELGEMSLAMQAKLLRVLQDARVRRVGGNQDIAIDVRVICATNRDLLALIQEGLFREDLYYRINVVQVHLPPLTERREDIRWYAHQLVDNCQQIEGNRSFYLSAATESWLVRQDWPGNIRQLKNQIERACVNADGERLDVTLFDQPRVAPVNSGPWLKAYMEQCERERVETELRVHDYHINDTAKALGISRKNLWEKMRKHGL